VVTDGRLISPTRMNFAGEMRAKGDKIPLFSFSQDSGCQETKHFGCTPFLTDQEIGAEERGFEVAEDIEVSAYESLSEGNLSVGRPQNVRDDVGLLILQVKRWNWLVSPIQRVPSQSSMSKFRGCISRKSDCTNFNRWAADGSSVREEYPAITFVRLDWIHSEGCRLDTDRR
jgi:hypothetical protein